MGFTYGICECSIDMRGRGILAPTGYYVSYLIYYFLGIFYIHAFCNAAQILSFNMHSFAIDTKGVLANPAATMLALSVINILKLIL